MLVFLLLLLVAFHCFSLSAFVAFGCFWLLVAFAFCCGWLVLVVVLLLWFLAAFCFWILSRLAVSYFWMLLVLLFWLAVFGYFLVLSLLLDFYRCFLSTFFLVFICSIPVALSVVGYRNYINSAFAFLLGASGRLFLCASCRSCCGWLFFCGCFQE